MESLSLTTATTCNSSKIRLCIPCYKNPTNPRNLPFPQTQHGKLVVFAAKDENKLSSWDQMEVKFGRLLGEDPKLTLAKIVGRKLNPELSYLEIEKLFNKKCKKTANCEIEESKERVKFDTNDKPLVPEKKRPNLSVSKAPNNPKQSIQHVILRKPATFKEDDIGTEISPRLTLKPNLSLKIGKEHDKERFTDMILVRKPEPFMRNDEETFKEAGVEAYRDHSGSSFDIDDTETGSRNVELTSEMGNVTKFDLDPSRESGDVSKLQDLGQESDCLIDQREMSNCGLENPVRNAYAGTSENLPPVLLLKEREETDWKRAEDLIKTARRTEVELISSSTRGFVASFGSLIGFLPYRNLATKWKYLAFESWLRRKGLDPVTYRKAEGFVGSYGATSKKFSSNSIVDAKKVEGERSPDMKLEDLLAIYDQEKIRYLSSFVGQKIKANVVLADGESRKLIFSVKPKEKEESVERKKSLMAKLSIGDVVKCCIKKFTYFGIFVEVEGVPALIHHTQVSWDPRLIPASYFKIGQVVEAKVLQLDFSLERILLSLKEITPDPLIEALEAVLGDCANLDGRLEANQPENEWVDVESLIKDLQQYEGVELVTKGRFFLSPNLAPTFTVYMASIFENQYKLLARSGNKVQEVVVHTSLGKVEMRSAILTCVNRLK